MVKSVRGHSVVDAPSGNSKENTEDTTSIVDVQPRNQTQFALSVIKTLVS